MIVNNLRVSAEFNLVASNLMDKNREKDSGLGIATRGVFCNYLYLQPRNGVESVRFIINSRQLEMKRSVPETELCTEMGLSRFLYQSRSLGGLGLNCKILFIYELKKKKKELACFTIIKNKPERKLHCYKKKYFICF